MLYVQYEALGLGWLKDCLSAVQVYLARLQCKDTSKHTELNRESSRCTISG